MPIHEVWIWNCDTIGSHIISKFAVLCSIIGKEKPTYNGLSSEFFVHFRHTGISYQNSAFWNIVLTTWKLCRFFLIVFLVLYICTMHCKINFLNCTRYLQQKWCETLLTKWKKSLQILRCKLSVGHDGRGMVTLSLKLISKLSFSFCEPSIISMQHKHLSLPSKCIKHVVFTF